MGFMMATGACFGCNRLFTFNPELVPSCKGKPICQRCVNLANPLRIENGLEPIRVLPGAYEAQEVA